MNNLTKLLVILITTFVMTACGGGSSDSFTATISAGPTSHVCKSEAAANMCQTGDCAQCQCQSGCPAGPGEAITLSCLFYDGIARIPSTGCALATTTVRTLACSGTQLFVRDGQGYTRVDVLQGAMFSGPQPHQLFGLKFTCGS